MSETVREKIVKELKLLSKDLQKALEGDLETLRSYGATNVLSCVSSIVFCMKQLLEDPEDYFRTKEFLNELFSKQSVFKSRENN